MKRYRLGKRKTCVEYGCKVEVGYNDNFRCELHSFLYYWPHFRRFFAAMNTSGAGCLTESGSALSEV